MQRGNVDDQVSDSIWEPADLRRKKKSDIALQEVLFDIGKVLKIPVEKDAKIWKLMAKICLSNPERGCNIDNDIFYSGICGLYRVGVAAVSRAQFEYDRTWT
jgi:hypothetical protein